MVGGAIGDALGYMPSAVLTHILHRIVYPKDCGLTLKEIVQEAKETVCELYKDKKHVDDLSRIIDQAVCFAQNSASDREEFTQNEYLKDILLGTGNSILAETDPYDGIYGVGLNEELAKDLEQEYWR